MADNCGTCSYARTMPADLANAGALVCCFNPPVMHGEFPMVRADLWCGQYKSTGPQKKKAGVLRKKPARRKAKRQT
jgi:hypothetical protein